MIQNQQEQKDAEFLDPELEFEDDFNSMPKEIREHALDAGHPDPSPEPAPPDPETPIEEIASSEVIPPAESSAPNIPVTTDDHRAEPETPEKAMPDTSVMGVGAFMGAIILLSLPVFDIIFIIEWAFSRHVNRNKRNLARAALLIRLILVLVFAGVCIAARQWYQFDLLGFLITTFKGY